MTLKTKAVMRRRIARKLRESVEAIVNDEALTAEFSGGGRFDRDLRRCAIGWEYDLKKAIERIVR